MKFANYIGERLGFENKCAIVTGAARGIGRSICLELGRLGCNIAFNYSKSLAEAEQLASELSSMNREVFFCEARVEDLSAATRMVEDVRNRFGRIDYLVNNAGITRDKLILRMTEKDWDDVISTNLKGAFNFSKAAVPIMLKAKSGSILNISSISGIIGVPGQTNYSASKAGMIGLTKALAREVASRNISVNALALGFVDTEMTRHFSEEYKAGILKSIPLGRFCSIEEAARLAAFLLSDDARYITGQVLQADGGLAI